ncbi:hypothetical protein HanPSC8_Chr11g0498141 [Helianthus annuus]|nr:hypothetical protein HanPSC8_Chr11g0498141 [Helianthus annuus]
MKNGSKWHKNPNNEVLAQGFFFWIYQNQMFSNEPLNKDLFQVILDEIMDLPLEIVLLSPTCVLLGILY